MSVKLWPTRYVVCETCKFHKPVRFVRKVLCKVLTVKNHWKLLERARAQKLVTALEARDSKTVCMTMSSLSWTKISAIEVRSDTKDPLGLPVT